MSDLVRAIAFAFRRKGLDRMPAGDLRMLLAYDLRWFAPEDAKRVVQRALEAGLLIDEGGTVRCAFDQPAVEIPLNFRPSLDVLDDSIAVAPPPARAAPLIAPAPASPAAAPAADDIARAAEDERRRRGLMISPEVARLIVRRRAGDDVAADAAALEAKLLSA